MLAMDASIRKARATMGTSFDDLVEAAPLTGDPDQPPLLFIDLDTLHELGGADLHRAVTLLSSAAVVTVGRATRPVPPSLAPILDVLTTTLAPSGPGRGWVAADAGAVERIRQTVATAPTAAVTLANLLPAVARADVHDGLMLESLAYSMLLAGDEFAAWRARERHTPGPRSDDVVLLERDRDTLTITLNRPQRHNAYSAAMRDALIDGLELARLDESITQVTLRGAGPSYCAGGDLAEFGTAGSPAAAHLVRLSRSAGRLVHELRDRVTVEVHGACIGAGVEIPSFAGRVVARSDAFFQLPELAMGLIPGAGGTVSLTGRIGRWRTAFLALTADRLPARTALAWGLVDALA